MESETCSSTPRRVLGFLTANKKNETPQKSKSVLSYFGNSTKIFESKNFMCVTNTPPNYGKIKNPFEPALTESLHLPLICSPSLFQRPRTPRHSNSIPKFEWTIEDVSSLNPVNVEPNETQFQCVSDPELEARAQAAISSYFKEQPVVPSPIQCALRSQKIELPPDVDMSIVVSGAKRLRDGITQTELTFPPNLPSDVEKLIKKFCTYTCNQQQSPTVKADSTDMLQELSLRRKLFEHSVHLEDDADISVSLELKTSSPPPATPELAKNLPLVGKFSCKSMQDKDNSKKPDISYSDTSFFGSLSPISKCGILVNEDSPETNLKIGSAEKSQHKARETPELDDNVMINSICARSTPERVKEKNNRVSIKDLKNLTQMSTNSDYDTFNSEEVKCEIAPLCSQGILNDLEDDNDMQNSQSSTKSSSSASSSINANTPMRKRRSPSRKNLSQSFSCHYSDSEDDYTKENSFASISMDVMDLKIGPLKWL